MALLKKHTLKEEVAETGGCSASLILSELLLGSLKTLHRLHPHRDHIVLSHYSNSWMVSSYSLNQFDTPELGIYGIYRPMQSLIKAMHLHLNL